MSDPRADITAAPTALYGLRCGDEHHEGHGYGRVYAQGKARHKLESLAAGKRCYQLVVSTDDGHTWTATQ